LNNQAASFLKKYKIAGVTFTVESDFLFAHENLSLFEISSDEVPDFRITSHRCDLSDVRDSFGASILSSEYMDVYENKGIFCFCYKNSPEIHSCEYDTINQTAEIIVLNESKPGVGYEDFTFKDFFFFAIRDVFFCYCQQMGMITLHSSSIIYNGHAYLFSAPSGTGKSTHTDLWEKYCVVRPLNGDVALLSVKDNNVYAHGIPWCGTSGKYLNETVPLGHIIFLRRAHTNDISVMNSFEAILNICSRSFSPNWTKALSERTLNIAKEIERISPCLLLKCLPEKGAMELVKEYIDKEKSR